MKSEDYIGPLLEFLFDALGHSEANALDLSRAKFDARKIRSYNMREANDIESNLRNMEWLLVHLYYLSLKYTSSLARAWWLDCKSKQTRMAVESWTERFFSPLVIEDTIEEVEGWAEQQDSTEDEKELIIKASRRSREVFASYEVDDMMMQIVIRLPHTYPLDGVKVEGINRVAVSEKKWTSWMMNTQGVITFSVSPLQVFSSSTDRTITERLYHRRADRFPKERHRRAQGPHGMLHLLQHHLQRQEDAGQALRNVQESVPLGVSFQVVCEQ